jgi:pimeloyl-ACP methyl ester carboxylesterase
MTSAEALEIDSEWVHIAYQATSTLREVYGYNGRQGTVNLEGVRFRSRRQRSGTLLIYMHPASTLQLLPVPRAMAAAGVDVLCAGSRYARNDTPLIMEMVALDLGAYVRHAREVWGYDTVVLVGWSGGGSLSVFYQSLAESPTVTHTPAWDPVDLSALPPADAVIFQAAHLSRAIVLSEFIDPSVVDENDPDVRDVELDLYDSRNPNQPPYSPEFISRFRAAQLARVRRRTVYVRELLDQLRTKEGPAAERGLLTHRTLADPRFLDAAIEPSDRVIGWCFLGRPREVNQSPAGIGRYSTLRAWLSQWSIDDTNARADRNITSVHVPLLAIENSADDAVPRSHVSRVFEASPAAVKDYVLIKGANHYYADQPQHLQEAVQQSVTWLRRNGLAT